MTKLNEEIEKYSKTNPTKLITVEIIAINEKEYIQISGQDFFFGLNITCKDKDKLIEPIFELLNSLN